MSTGTGESTIGGPHHVVLPFKAPISGPNSLLAMSTSRYRAAGKTACLQDLDEILVQWASDHNLQLPGDNHCLWS